MYQRLQHFKFNNLAACGAALPWLALAIGMSMGMAVGSVGTWLGSWQLGNLAFLRETVRL